MKRGDRTSTSSRASGKRARRRVRSATARAAFRLRPRRRRARRPDRGKRTLLGIVAPTLPLPAPSGSTPRPCRCVLRRRPPVDAAASGRRAWPDAGAAHEHGAHAVGSRGAARRAHPASPAPRVRAAAATAPNGSAPPPPPPPVHVEQAAAGVDVDWEDEDEATHIFDESHEAPKAAAAAAAPPAKMTLLGLTRADIGPRRRRRPWDPRTPPPPAPLSSQPPRMSGFPPVPSSSAAGLPPPPVTSHIPPPPGTTPGLGSGYPSRIPSAPAPAPLRMSAPPMATMQTAHTPFPRPAAVPEYLPPHRRAMEATALVRPPPEPHGALRCARRRAVVVALAWRFSFWPVAPGPHRRQRDRFEGRER